MPAQVQSPLVNGNASQHKTGQKPAYKHDFDLSITESVINATGPKANARLREVFANLTRHLHDFCRESEITRSEFEATLKMVSLTDPLEAELQKLTNC